MLTARSSGLAPAAPAAIHWTQRRVQVVVRKWLVRMRPPSAKHRFDLCSQPVRGWEAGLAALRYRWRQPLTAAAVAMPSALCHRVMRQNCIWRANDQPQAKLSLAAARPRWMSAPGDRGSLPDRAFRRAMLPNRTGRCRQSMCWGRPSQECSSTPSRRTRPCQRRPNARKSSSCRHTHPSLKKPPSPAPKRRTSGIHIQGCRSPSK